MHSPIKNQVFTALSWLWNQTTWFHISTLSLLNCGDLSLDLKMGIHHLPKIAVEMKWNNIFKVPAIPAHSRHSKSIRSFPFPSTFSTVSPFLPSKYYAAHPNQIVLLFSHIILVCLLLLLCDLLNSYLSFKGKFKCYLFNEESLLDPNALTSVCIYLLYGIFHLLLYILTY